MSGGSFDYACYEMESGELRKFCMNADRFLAKLDRLIKIVDTLEDSQGPIDLPEGEKFEAQIAVAGARQAFAAARDAVRDLERRMKDLAGIAHDVEWWCSGDYGAASAAKGCVKWMRARLAP